MATAVIINDLNNKVRKIYPIDYPAKVVVKDILPFRVKFIPIQIESLFGNPPGVGFQVIGYSNYIL